MTLPQERLEKLVLQYVQEEICGNTLAKMYEKGEITKGERRKILKLAMKKRVEAAPKELSERQKQRLAVKEKKALPKLSKEDRKRKYTQDILDSREEAKSKHMECLGCRKKGHMLKDCPNARERNGSSGHCFNCGSADHALRNCPHPIDGKALKFAKCFICGGVGHISKACPENANGLYPKGGCCHICLQKTHLVKDCPQRTEEDAERHRRQKQAEQDAALGPRIGLTVDDENKLGGDYDDFDIASNSNESDAGDESAKLEKSKKLKKSKTEVHWHKGMKKRKGNKK